MDADIAGDGQAFFFGLPYQFDTFCGGQTAQVYPCAGDAHQFEYRMQADGFGNGRNADKSETSGNATGVCHAVSRQKRVFRLQP